jgi:hypothetical protein
MDLMHYVGPRAIWFRTRACGQFKLVLKVCGQLIFYIGPMGKLFVTYSLWQFICYVDRTTNLLLRR